MITKNDLVPFILKVEPEFEEFCKQEREYWKMETANRDMASLSVYVEDKLKGPGYSTAKKLFDAIEFLLIENNADIEVQNAVCASFLENLLNYSAGGNISSQSFVPFLGLKSRECCRAWDKLTGTKTPGLWD